MGTRSELAVVVVALAGCDRAFQLDEVGPIPPDVAVGTPCPAVASGPDEDGDGCANVVDDCPGMPDPMQIDSDGDGIGDACDPHPNRRGDRIVAAAFFDTQNDSDWALVTPDWTVAGGAMSNGVATQMTRALPMFPGVELGYTVVGKTDHNAELRLNFGVGLPTAVNCHVDYNAPSFDLFLMSHPGVSITDLMQHFSLHIDDLGSTCMLSGLPVTTSDVIAGPFDATLEVQNDMRIQLDYILVYQFTPE